jgi:predicted Rossmann-fold nucleotide-binding protein
MAGQATASHHRGDKNQPVAAPVDTVLRSAAELTERFPDLEAALVVGLDLDAVRVDWRLARAAGSAFLGCDLGRDTHNLLRERGAVIVEALDHVGFEPFRADLYTNDELMSGYEAGDPATTLDARIGIEAQLPQTPARTVARGIHDATIDAALTRFLDGAPGPIVGVMGSHSVPRGTDTYRLVAELGRDLSRAGYVVTTGGGPGLMEAANLGAWLAPFHDDALAAAIELLERAPLYDAAPAEFLEAAVAVRRRWPRGGTSLGVPTWLYVDEPLNQFSERIAKYFANSIRENGLLAIALGGVVYAPGGIGTAQEVFTDAAQNGYTMYGVRSPMVFLGREHYERDQPALVEAVRGHAAQAGWEHLVRVVDDVPSAVAAIDELVPSDLPRPPRHLPLRHR